MTGTSRLQLVAVISADHIRTPESYGLELFRQWKSCGADLPALPVGGNTLTRITQFLDLLPSSRPAIQVITRFHKILDVFDASFLGDLRDRERASLVRSVCVSPHGYDELRQRWRQHGHFFCNSDYGWSHHVELVTPLNADEAVKMAASTGIPEHIARLIVVWTGAYPEPFECVAQSWIRSGRPKPSSRVQADLRGEAQKSLKRFVKWLDPGENTIYRDAVLKLQTDPEQEEALLLLERHPWKELLLTNRRLRAEQLAGTVVSEYLKPGGYRDTDLDLWNKGAALYRGWRFAMAKKLLSMRLAAGGLPGYLTVLNAHCTVMTEMFGGDSEAPMADCNWETTKSALNQMRGQVRNWRLQPEHQERLLARYEDLMRFCGIVQKAELVSTRVVDVLLGLRGGNGELDRRAAITLLVAHFTYDSRIPGDTQACQAALPLLEQVFRAWAFVALGINYYEAPTGNEGCWASVERCFNTPVRRPDAGTAFPSFECFAYFAILLHEKLSPDAKALRPEVDCKALERSLSVLDVRRDLAHSLALVNPTSRRKYFEIMERWIECLLSCDPTMGTREELLSAVEPLPLISPEGQFV